MESHIFWFITTVIHTVVWWIMAPSSLVGGHQRFGGTHYCYLRGRDLYIDDYNSTILRNVGTWLPDCTMSWRGRIWLATVFNFPRLNNATDLIDALPSNSSVNTVQHATIEMDVFSVSAVTSRSGGWSHDMCFLWCVSVPRLYKWQNSFASSKGLGPEKDCAGKGQQRIQKTDPSSRQRGRPTKTRP
jgi:hypothetical protein